MQSNPYPEDRDNNQADAMHDTPNQYSLTDPEDEQASQLPPPPLLVNALPSPLIIIFQWAGLTLVALFFLHGIFAVIPQLLASGGPRLAGISTVLERAPLLLIGVVFMAVSNVRVEPDLERDETWRPKQNFQPRMVMLLLAIAFLALPVLILFASIDVEKGATRETNERARDAVAEISQIRNSLKAGSYSQGQVQQLLQQRPALLTTIALESGKGKGSEAPLEQVTTEQLIHALTVSERQVMEQRREAIAGVQTELLGRQIRLDLTAVIYALSYALFWIVWPVAYRRGDEMATGSYIEE
jgi:hypothetical protein